VAALLAFSSIAIGLFAIGIACLKESREDIKKNGPFK